MALHSHVEDMPAQAAVGARPHHLRASVMDFLLLWICYSLHQGYIQRKRNMLSYARLIIREHWLAGWNLTTAAAALTTQHPCQQQSCPCVQGKASSVNTAECQIMLMLSAHYSITAVPATLHSRWEGHQTRPETSQCICISWNKGRCALPGSCRFRHVAHSMV